MRTSNKIFRAIAIILLVALTACMCGCNGKLPFMKGEEKTQEELDLLADRIGAPHRKASELGYIQTKPLMWDNEPARHKLLDLIGDMALVGRRIHGHISAIRPGHTINNRFARLLRQELNS